MNPLIQLKQTTSVFLVVLGLAGFALSPGVQAVSPPPDGGYPGGNTAEGQNALLSLTSGTFNTAVGVFSLESNRTNRFNTAIGAGALLVNTADENTATGAGALFSNTTGFQNTANGGFALFANTTGNFNAATGFKALPVNTTGSFNTANGAFALFSNTIGINNTASGAGALSFSTTAVNNTAIGYQALLDDTTGGSNTAIGFQALSGNTTGDFNITLGVGAGSNLTTGSNNIDIGNLGVAGESGVLRIGDAQTQTFVAGITGAVIPSGSAVVVDPSDGQLGVLTSSARFKTEIRPIDKASEAILALKPITFRYKKEIDSKGVPQFGLVAEEVAKVNPDLVVRDKEGKPFSVRYDAVNAMLLNEFLKEHSAVQELKKQVAALSVTMKAQAALIQKVSDKLDLNTPAPQVAEDNQ